MAAPGSRNEASNHPAARLVYCNMQAGRRRVFNPAAGPWAGTLLALPHARTTQHRPPTPVVGAYAWDRRPGSLHVVGNTSSDRSGAPPHAQRQHTQARCMQTFNGGRPAATWPACMHAARIVLLLFGCIVSLIMNNAAVAHRQFTCSTEYIVLVGGMAACMHACTINGDQLLLQAATPAARVCEIPSGRFMNVTHTYVRTDGSVDGPS